MSPYSRTPKFDAVIGEMQKALDIVGTSRHSSNKIAATIFGEDQSGHAYSHAFTNYWPDPIIKAFPNNERIGNSSGTIHAETACILYAPFTNGASLCITDPFCPNCAKNIAEAGIKTIFIDSRGFAKDFAMRRSDQFENMSMRICEKAGISVYNFDKQAQSITPIFVPPADYIPPEDSPVEIESLDNTHQETFSALIARKKSQHKGRKFALAMAQDKEGRIFGISARSHPAVGYVAQWDGDELKNPQGKYSFTMEPLNRILMNAPRYGLKLIDGLIYVSQAPTSREQVNFIGAGLRELMIENTDKARDEDGLKALKQLTEAGLLTVKSPSIFD